MKKFIVILSVLFTLSLTSLCSANKLHDLQDDLPVDKSLHFAAGYIITDQLERNAHMSKLEAVLTTTAIAWAKEKWVDDHVDNKDAYATMAGALFYQIKF